MESFVVKRLMYVAVGATTAQEAIEEAKKLDKDDWTAVPNTYRAMPFSEHQKRLVENEQFEQDRRTVEVPDPEAEAIAVARQVDPDDGIDDLARRE